FQSCSPFAPHLYSVDFPSFPTRRSSDLAAVHVHHQHALGSERAACRLEVAAQLVAGLEAVVGEIERADDIHGIAGRVQHVTAQQDRKSTRLNSSHVKISYAVFCLKIKRS